DLRVRAHHLRERGAREIETRVVRLAVAVHVQAGLLQAAVAERRIAVEREEHRRRGVEHDRDARARALGVLHARCSGADGRHARARFAARAGVDRFRARAEPAGLLAEALVDLAVEVVVVAVAEFTDVGAVELELARAAAGLALADVADAAFGAAHVEGR